MKKEEELKENKSSFFEKTRDYLRGTKMGKLACTLVLAGMFTAGAAGCVASSKVEAAGNNQTTTEQTESGENDNETTVASSTETEKSTEELISEAEIPAGLSDEETAKLIIDRLSDWNMAGATDEFYDKTINDNGPAYKEHLAEEAKKWADIYAQALFGDNYKDNQATATFVNGMEEANEDCLSCFMASKVGSSHGLYDMDYTIKNIESVDNSDGTITLTVDYVQSDNAAETAGGDTDLSAHQIGTFNVVDENGKIVIKSFSFSWAE